MKILFFTLTLRGGGAERVLVSLSNGMVKKHDVVIATVHNDEDYYELNDEIKRIRLDKNKWDSKAVFRNNIRKVSIRRIFKLIKVIKSESPDIIVTFLPLPSIYIMLAKRFSRVVNKVPVILSERGDPNREYNNTLIVNLIKKLYKNADGFVFQTREAENFYKNIINCKTAIIENPINETFLNRKLPKKRHANIVSCGRLEKQKNFELLIAAFADVIKDYPEYKLEIYGEGSRKDELLKLAGQLGLGGKVRLMGRVENVADRIVDAGLFVLSSDFEGMPNALMEAMALGIPCISTDCPVGGPRALIKNGENGILIEVGSEKQLVDAMKKIASDKKYALKLSENSCAWARSYALDKIVDKWKRFIEIVLGGK